MKNAAVNLPGFDLPYSEEMPKGKPSAPHIRSKTLKLYHIIVLLANQNGDTEASISRTLLAMCTIKPSGVGTSPFLGTAKAAALGFLYAASMAVEYKKTRWLIKPRKIQIPCTRPPSSAILTKASFTLTVGQANPPPDGGEPPA